MLLFRNISAHTCSLYGYPGLDALNATGHVLAHAQRTMTGRKLSPHSLYMRDHMAGMASAYPTSISR